MIVLIVAIVALTVGILIGRADRRRASELQPVIGQSPRLYLVWSRDAEARKN